MDLFGGVLPLEKICRFLLNDKFSKYLKTKITKEQLTLHLPSGTLNVSGIELNPSIFNRGRKAIVLRAAKIGNVQIQMAGKAAQSFFSDTVHDNLNVKVSEVYAELDFFMDLNTDVASQAQASDDEDIIASVFAAIGVSSTAPVSLADSWSELEAQMPSDADGREQLSHIIKQFLLLAEVEVSVVSVVCNVFRSGPHYHPSQFRFTIDSAKFLNDFSHLKGKSMPSSSVEHLTQIIFGRQFQIGKISIDARDCLAKHCTVAAFEDQKWIPIFSAEMSASSHSGSDQDPFCKLQFQLKGFDSDLDFSVLKVDFSIDNCSVMLDFVHVQLLLSFAKNFLSKGSSVDVGVASASHQTNDNGLSERVKCTGSLFEQAGTVEDLLTARIKSLSFLVACIDQPLRATKRRELVDSDWLFTLQGVCVIAGPVTIHATSDVVLFQELFSDGRRHEIVRVASQDILHQQCGVSIKVACDSSSTKISLASVRVDLDFELLHRLNASFYWPVKSLQALFPKSSSSQSSLSLDAASIEVKVRLPEDVIQYYRVQHCSRILALAISQLSLQLHSDESFHVTFDDAELNILPDFVIIRRLASIPNTITFRKNRNDQVSFCMACDIALSNVDVRLSIQMRQMIFTLGTEFATRIPQAPLDPPSLGKNFKRSDSGVSDEWLPRSDSQSSDDDQNDGNNMGIESELRRSMYVSAHSSFPLEESASLSQSSDPTLFPLYLVLMRNALHAMGASFSGEDSSSPNILHSVQELSQDVSLALNYTFSVLVEKIVIVLAGAITLPDTSPFPAPSEKPFFCGFDSSHKTKLAELNAIDSLVLLSRRLEIVVSVVDSPSSTHSHLKFGSCQIIDSYDRVHLEPFYPFDGMLPSQSVSDKDRHENGQIAINFESGGKCIDITFTQLLVHYGPCNWIHCIIRFFTDTQPVHDNGNSKDQETSEHVKMILMFKLVAFQPALLPLPFASPSRLFVEEASVSLMPGVDDILKTISIQSKTIHVMVSPHVDHIMTCSGRLITSARYAHLNAVDGQHAPRRGSANPNPDIARILRTDCTLDWHGMDPLEFSASCGFLWVATVPMLCLVPKSSPIGLILELHDLELSVFACADSLARFLAKAASNDDDVVVIESPRFNQVDESVGCDPSVDVVVLSAGASVQLPEEGYRFVPDAHSSDETIYDKVKNSLVFHWSLLAGPNQLDASCESSQVPVEKHADKRDVAVDESFLHITDSSLILGESFTNIPSASASIDHEEGYGQENSDQRNVSVESTLDTFLSWRLELVNARVRFRLYAGCDFPEYVASEESTSPSSCAPHSSLRNRDLDRSLELHVEGMHLRYSSYEQAAAISSKISFKAQDVKIEDHVTDTFFRCLVQKDVSYLECGAYERDAPAVSLNLETRQSVVSGSCDSQSVQRRFEMNVLPLIFSLDERTLNAIWEFMHIYSSVAAENESSDSGAEWDVGEDRVLYQTFMISALHFCLNYKPIKYPIILRDSPVNLPSVKLWNCESGQVLESILKQWGGLQEIFKQFLGGVANSVPVVSNIAHIFSALNVLIHQSIRNRSSPRQVRRNVFSFLSALSGEVIDVALIATRVTDQLLSGASSVVVGGARRYRQSRSTDTASGVKEAQMLQSLQEDLKKIQQPANVQEGLQEALRSFSHGLECMMMTVLQPGRHSFLRRGAAAIMMPVQGVNRGVFQFLQGLMNQLQPQRRVRRDEKYKDAPSQQKQ